MVDCMLDNIDFACNKLISIGRKTCSNLWTVLRNSLNETGGAKNVKKCQRVWTNMKVKKKAAAEKSSRNKTGGGLGIAEQMTPTDKKLLFIVNSESVSGITGPDETNLDTGAPVTEKKNFN